MAGCERRKGKTDKKNVELTVAAACYGAVRAEFHFLEVKQGDRLTPSSLFFVLHYFEQDRLNV